MVWVPAGAFLAGWRPAFAPVCCAPAQRGRERAEGVSAALYRAVLGFWAVREARSGFLLTAIVAALAQAGPGGRTMGARGKLEKNPGAAGKGAAVGSPPGS